jgi:glycosyltransferase involved in cell wall biosynthesis
MRVIFLTQYFPPETGAPQNRLFATAKALHKRGARVTVLTAMPNYPDNRVQEGYRGRLHMRESLDGLTVHRAWIFVAAGRSIGARLLNYFSFVFSSLLVGLLKLKRSDVLLVESPPLFLGITAMLLARAKRAKLVFNVSDLWPESAVQLGLVTNRTLIAWSSALERRCYRRAALITGQTQGIVANIGARCPGKKVLWVPNGVDFTAITEAEQATGTDMRARTGIGANDLVLAYAGIIGHAQGLEVILRAAALLRDRRDIHFLLIGDGPEKAKLQQLKSALGDVNVRFVDRMPRAELLALMRSIDAVVVPLRRNDLFRGAIPSKIFEALALRKPVLLGVEGEAKSLFIEQGGGGLAFEPENEHALADAVLKYHADRTLLATHGAAGERYVREHFDRERINERLWQAMNDLG